MTHATRRAALASAAGLVSTIGAATARAADPSADIVLIRCCDRIVAAQGEIDRIHTTRRTVADEVRTDPLIEHLETQSKTATKELEQYLPPKTQAGARALARATLACWDRAPDGDFVCHDVTEWLAASLAEAIAFPPEVV